MNNPCFVSFPPLHCVETVLIVRGGDTHREEKLAEERAGRAAERMELRELRSREAGYARELKDRADEIEQLNQVYEVVFTAQSTYSANGCTHPFVVLAAASTARPRWLSAFRVCIGRPSSVYTSVFRVVRERVCVSF